MKKIFTLILSLALVQGFGQTTPAIVMQVISSAGGSFSTTGLSVDWTLGEPVIGTGTGTGLILTQGFQQGNLLGTDVPNDPEEISTDLKMYPNPAINKVYFNLSNKEVKGAFIVEVFDVTGRKVLYKDLGQFNQETMDLSVASLRSGIYLVKVKVGGFESGMVKLIKE